MRKFLSLLMLLALFGAVCFGQSQMPGDQAPASAQQPQRPDVYDQGPPPPPEAKQPDLPQDMPEAQEPPPAPDAQQAGDPQDRTPELKTRPQPVKTIPANRTLNAGTEIRASLDRLISSKSSQAGDEFTATILEPLLNPDGQVLVHSGAKIHGRIAGIERGKLFGSLRNANARLNLRFTDLVLDSGEPLPLEASLAGINETSTKSKAKSNEEGDISSSGGSGKQTARDIGVGAGAGTLVGLVLGSAWKGAIIGALAGGGYVLANQGRDVELPASTGLRIRLDKYLTVPEYALRPDAGMQPPASRDGYDDYDQSAPPARQQAPDRPAQDQPDRDPRN